MSLCTECASLRYCKAIRAVNIDAELAERITKRSQGIIDLWNTTEADKVKYRQKIEATKASHE